MTSSEALAAAQPLVWLKPEPQDGAQWFAEHRARIQEMLDPKAPSAQPNE